MATIGEVKTEDQIRTALSDLKAAIAYERDRRERVANGKPVRDLDEATFGTDFAFERVLEALGYRDVFEKKPWAEDKSKDKFLQPKRVRSGDTVVTKYYGRCKVERFNCIGQRLEEEYGFPDGLPGQYRDYPLHNRVTEIWVRDAKKEGHWISFVEILEHYATGPENNY